MYTFVGATSCCERDLFQTYMHTNASTHTYKNIYTHKYMYNPLHTYLHTYNAYIHAYIFLCKVMWDFIMHQFGSTQEQKTGVGLAFWHVSLIKSILVASIGSRICFELWMPATSGRQSSKYQDVQRCLLPNNLKSVGDQHATWSVASYTACANATMWWTVTCGRIRTWTSQSWTDLLTLPCRFWVIGKFNYPTT